MEEHKSLHLTARLWQERYNLEIKKEKLAFEILDLEKRRLDFLAGTTKRKELENAIRQFQEKNGSNNG